MSWIVTLDVLKWVNWWKVNNQWHSWIVTLDVLKSYNYGFLIGQKGVE